MRDIWWLSNKVSKLRVISERFFPNQIKRIDIMEDDYRQRLEQIPRSYLLVSYE